MVGSPHHPAEGPVQGRPRPPPSRAQLCAQHTRGDPRPPPPQPPPPPASPSPAGSRSLTSVAPTSRQGPAITTLKHTSRKTKETKNPRFPNPSYSLVFPPENSSPSNALCALRIRCLVYLPQEHEPCGRRGFCCWLSCHGAWDVAGHRNSCPVSKRTAHRVLSCFQTHRP